VSPYNIRGITITYPTQTSTYCGTHSFVNSCTPRAFVTDVVTVENYLQKCVYVYIYVYLFRSCAFSSHTPTIPVHKSVVCSVRYLYSNSALGSEWRNKSKTYKLHRRLSVQLNRWLQYNIINRRPTKTQTILYRLQSLLSSTFDRRFLFSAWPLVFSVLQTIVKLCLNRHNFPASNYGNRS